MKQKNVIGLKYGRLTIVARAHKTKTRAWFVECQCDCGNSLVSRLSDILAGKTKSCGCLHTEAVVAVKTKHRGCGRGITEKLYQTWNNIKRRCCDINHPAFKYYGGKGVFVCEEWSSSYSEFRKWAFLNGYEDGLALDRIDGKDGYCPENCQFLTASEHSRKTNLERGRKLRDACPQMGEK